MLGLTLAADVTQLYRKITGGKTPYEFINYGLLLLVCIIMEDINFLCEEISQ